GLPQTRPRGGCTRTPGPPRAPTGRESRECQEYEREPPAEGPRRDGLTGRNEASPLRSRRPAGSRAGDPPSPATVHEHVPEPPGRTRRRGAHAGDSDDGEGRQRDRVDAERDPPRRRPARGYADDGGVRDARPRHPASTADRCHPGAGVKLALHYTPNKSPRPLHGSSPKDPFLPGAARTAD